MTTYIKTLAYKTKNMSSDSYSYVVNLLLGNTDPESVARASICLPRGCTVLHSTQKRVTDTLNTQLDAEYIPLKELDEIRFDVSLFCSPAEWEKHQSTAVRKAFKEAFITDRLQRSREILFKEITKIVSLCEKSSRPVFVISHSFRLKVLESFLKTEGAIVVNPTQIHEYISDTKKTLPFGGVFTF